MRSPMNDCFVINLYITFECTITMQLPLWQSRFDLQFLVWTDRVSYHT